MPQVFRQNFGYVDWERLYQKNWERLRAGMKEKEIDSLIVQNIHNVRYFTGYASMYPLTAMLNTYAAVFPRDAESPTLYPFWPYEEYVRTRHKWLKGVVPTPASIDDWPDAFNKLELGERIGVDSEMMYQLGKLLETKLKRKEIVIADDVLYGARSVKNDEELKVMREAIAIVDLGFEKAFEACVVGKREFEVGAEVEYVIRRAGAEGITHFLAESGEHAGIPGAGLEVATDKIIERNETVIFDFGAVYEGYNAEWSRTKFMGKPSKDQLEAYRLVYESEQKAISKIKPGVDVASADQAARDVLREGGWGPPYEFEYNIGHGIGVSVWELPVVYYKSKAKFEENNVVCIEPAVYKKGWGGVRVEDIVQVTSAGPKILTKTPYHYL